jgi:hypothetical protein
MHTLNVTGAHGKDYKSKKLLTDDWNAGKDFWTNGTPKVMQGYLSIRDVPAMKADGITHLEFRYNNNRDVLVLKLSSYKN